jgi:hypothetical protein
MEMGIPPMRALVLALSLVQVSCAAVAQSRPNTTALTCAEVKTFVAGRTSVLMNTGLSTYDVFVSGNLGCSYGTFPEPAWVRTRDNPECALNVCRGRSRPGS